MKQNKALNVAIVGGGPGCKAIMDMIFAEKLSQLQMNLVGVACTNPKAVGYVYAHEMGIYTTRDYHDLYAIKDLDMIIELTGVDKVAKEISRTKPDRIRLVDHVAARLFWDIFQIEEQRIAERRQAMEALKESEERFQQVAENAEEWIWEVDADGLYTYASPVVERILGYKPGDLVGKKHFYDLFYPDDKEELKKAAFEVFANKGTFREFINRNVHKHGESVWLSTSGVPIVDSGGKLIGYRGADTDITERRRAEEVLRASEERYRNVYTTAPLAFVVWDRECLVRDWNEGAQKMFGWSREEVIGRNFLEFLIPDGARPGVEDVVENVLRGELKPDVVNDNETKSGEIITCRWNNSPLRDSEGHIIGAMSLGLDITERRQAQEALVAAKEDWENTFDAITDMVMLLDDRHQIIRVNRAAAEALGTTKESLVGKKCYEAVHGTDHPLRRCPLMSTMKTLGPSTTELIEPKLGGTFICSTSPILNREGELTGYTHSLKDITEPKRLEAQLQHAQRMEAIGTLAGGIAHDFNNVLMGIQGHTSLVSLHTDPDHPHFGHLKGIEDMVQRGAELTRQLLGFARGGKYEVRPTDLNELVEKSSEMFGRTKKEIKVHTKHQKAIWPVEVDQAQIEQVLLNLYVNAWQAMPDGGDLYVETKNVTLGDNYTRPFSVEPGDYVKISVTDTGVGMDKKTQERVFDPFFTTKEMGRGTGLGLSSAYGIIRNHGGIINVYSERGQGATFNIYLPASKQEVPIKEKELPDEIQKGTGTILLADDEEGILEVGEEMLKEMGYNVMLAASGKEAVAMYEEHKDEIDLVILDMIMPEMGGGEAYDRMKEENPKVKALLSSGYSIDGQAAAILERGCNGFIQKPFSMKELSWEIREILDKE